MEKSSVGSASACNCQNTLQRSLVELLAGDIELAFTFLKTAESASDPKKASAFIQRARDVGREVRLFLGRIEDPQDWDHIHSLIDQLESAILRAVEK